MKKLITAALIAALIFSLCACGSSSGSTKDEATMDSAAVRSDFDAGSAYVESKIDVSNKTKSGKEDENGFYQYWSCNGSAQDDIKMEVEIEGKTVTVGETTISDLKELGFEIDAEHEKETLEPDAIEGVSLKIDGKACTFAVHNDTDKKQTLADLAVFQYFGAADENSPNFNYNGLEKDATLEDVIKIFGTPESNITLSADRNSTTITLDYNHSATEEDTMISDTLDIYLNYDAKDNTSVLSGFSLSRYRDKA